jgi:Ribbon-helix-helix protein, copG family.
MPKPGGLTKATLRKVGVYLDEETIRQIAELAEAYGISYSAVVRLAVRELYKKSKGG